MDKDVYLFFCSTVAQSVAGVLAFFGAFAMFRIQEVERTLSQQGQEFMRLLPGLAFGADELRTARDHHASGRYRALVDLIDGIKPRVPREFWSDDVQAVYGTLNAARHRREFIFKRGREILVVGMLAVLAALMAMAASPVTFIETWGLAACGALLLATAWTLLRGISIVLGTLPEA